MVDRGQRRIDSIAASKEYVTYFTKLKDSLQSLYEKARRCRSKGLDPTLEPEVSIAWDMAERVERLVGPKGVAKRIHALSTQMTRIRMAFKIAEEIVYGRFGHYPEQEVASQALRTALAIINEGVTVAPVQGIFDVKIKQNPDGTNYLAVYFAGPMRSAGGTAQALTIILGDFVRKLLGIDRYKPDTQEIRRFIEEIRLYERRIGSLQFHVPDEALLETLKNVPIEITGIGTEGVEVTTFRGLPRVETDRVRGGAVRVVNDGIVGRAMKVMRFVEEMGMDGWEWLKRVRAYSVAASGVDAKEIVGRPFLSTPSHRSGLRVRYGRARNTGLGAIGIHPATMVMFDDFVAVGTQIRMDAPGKSAIATPVNFIDGPIVRLKDGSVVRVDNEKQARELQERVDQILFLGDALVAFGEFLFNNRNLLPSSFTSEWWSGTLHDVIMSMFGKSVERASKEIGVPKERIDELIRRPFSSYPSVEESILLAQKLHIPIHPRYTFFWANITLEELVSLRSWLTKAEVTDQEMVVPYTKEGKEVLEKLCLPHRINGDKVIIASEEARVLSFCLALEKPSEKVSGNTTTEAVKNLSGVLVEDVARSFIEARMGRPEKAERGDMMPAAHVLFPIGLAGGPKRDVVKASKRGVIVVNVANMICPKCGHSGFTTRCQSCGTKTQLEMQCPRCGNTAIGEEVCPTCKVKMQGYRTIRIDLENMLSAAAKQLAFLPSVIRGVKELASKTRVPESIVKGILRSKYDVSVFKGGCVRFDATNAPLTHFKPEEIGTSIDKLRELGYDRDRYGKPLQDGSQVCELKAQDVILPEKCGEYFVSVANFMDELLSGLYKEDPHYKVKSKEDLIGQLVVGLSPHTSCGVLGRMMGYTKASVCYAHPLWHAAKRRDCDGDEDSIMLALDVLVNFSAHYLPDRIGGLMDAPLLLTPVLDPSEVDEEPYNMEVAPRYPVSFYEKSLRSRNPSELIDLVPILRNRIGRKKQFEKFFYTVETTNIAQGNLESMYKRLGTMTEKLEAQLRLAEKVRAVDVKNVVRRVLTAHFMKDIVGNLRKFTTQSFRCRACNAKFRRAPLNGRCPKCGSSKMSQTVFRGGIEKYLSIARDVVDKYDLEEYYQSQIAIVDNEIKTLFGERKEQVKLTKFA